MQPVVVAAFCCEASHGAASCDVACYSHVLLWSSCCGAAARCSVAGVVQPVVVLLDMV